MADCNPQQQQQPPMYGQAQPPMYGAAPQQQQQPMYGSQQPQPYPNQPYPQQHPGGYPPQQQPGYPQQPGAYPPQQPAPAQGVVLGHQQQPDVYGHQQPQQPPAPPADVVISPDKYSIVQSVPQMAYWAIGIVIVVVFANIIVALLAQNTAERIIRPVVAIVIFVIFMPLIAMSEQYSSYNSVLNLTSRDLSLNRNGIFGTCCMSNHQVNVKVSDITSVFLSRGGNQRSNIMVIKISTSTHGILPLHRVYIGACACDLYPRAVEYRDFWIGAFNACGGNVTIGQDACC